MTKLIGRREYGYSKLGVHFQGRWVLRDESGSYVSHGRYRNDLVEQFSDCKIEFVEK